MAQTAFHHARRCNAFIFFNNIFFQRAWIDADTDGDIIILGTVHYRFYLFRTADISGIQPKSICSCFGGCNRKSIIEMNVCNQRNINLLFNRRHRRGRFFIRHGDTHNFTSGILQAHDLGNCSGDILGRCVGHRLYCNGCRSTNFYIPDADLTGFFTLDFWKFH